MTLNLNDQPTSGSRYTTSQVFTEAVNDSRFVRTFGTVAILGSILLFLSAAVEIGIGLAVMGFGSTRYYRVLGLTVVIIAIAGMFVAPIAFLAPLALCAGVAVKGGGVLHTLETEGRDDPDWQDTRKRAVIGLILSAIASIVSGVWIILFLVAVILKARQ